MMAKGEHKRGRPVSWLAVVIILAGFTLGGLALVFGTWWLFWVSLGIVVVGGILAIAVDIFADVELDHLHEGEPHISPIRRQVVGGGGEGVSDTVEEIEAGDATDDTIAVDDGTSDAEKESAAKAD